MNDFHIHSEKSDGMCSVNDIVSMYIELGYKMISITDHDTIEAQFEASEMCAKDGRIKYVFGIEITSQYQGEDVHILGYFSGMPGKGFISFIHQESILRAINNVRVERKGLKATKMNNTESIINHVHNYNGIAILAHPIAYKDKLNKLLEMVDGVELIHPTQSPQFIDELYRRCENMNLFFSAGTDFHGEKINHDIIYEQQYNKYSKPIFKFEQLFV